MIRSQRVEDSFLPVDLEEKELVKTQQQKLKTLSPY